MKTVGLIINPEKKQAGELARQARALIEGRGLRVLVQGRSTTALAARCQLLLVFGGDGTMLRVAREMDGADTPVLGINAGSLGFLTAVPAETMANALSAVLDGRYKLQSRTMLQATLWRKGRRLQVDYALNEVLIARGATARIVRLEVRIDEELLTDYVCDGMIFASSTGSTAYSMSAGGPILTPGTDAFVMTPICPHSLTNRSLVIGRSTVVQTRILSQPKELVLTMDGQVDQPLRTDDVVKVCRSNRQLQLVMPEGHSYFETLRRKLRWSGSNL